MARALTLRYQESPAYLYSEKSALDVSSQLTEGRPTRGESSTAESDPIWGSARRLALSAPRRVFVEGRFHVATVVKVSCVRRGMRLPSPARFRASVRS